MVSMAKTKFLKWSIICVELILTWVHYFIEKLNQVRLASGLRVSDLPCMRIAHTRYLLKNFNMTPDRLSGHISIFGLVVFVLKPLLGNARQW